MIRASLVATRDVDSFDQGRGNDGSLSVRRPCPILVTINLANGQGRRERGPGAFTINIGLYSQFDDDSIIQKTWPSDENARRIRTAFHATGLMTRRCNSDGYPGVIHVAAGQRSLTKQSRAADC